MLDFIIGSQLCRRGSCPCAWLSIHCPGPHNLEIGLGLCGVWVLEKSVGVGGC